MKGFVLSPRIETKNQRHSFNRKQTLSDQINLEDQLFQNLDNFTGLEIRQKKLTSNKKNEQLADSSLKQIYQSSDIKLEELQSLEVKTKS